MRWRWAMPLAVFVLAASQGMGQEGIKLTLNLMPGGAASRVITGTVKGEWQAPEPIPVNLEVRVSHYIVVSQSLPNGDAVITVQPQGFQLKGKVGDIPLEWMVSADGHLQAQWGDQTFDSRKLPEEQQKQLRQALTASYEVTISPQGAIKGVKAPASVKAEVWRDVPSEPKIAQQIVAALLQALWTPLLPDKPVKVGDRWAAQVPLAVFENAETFPLPLTCTLDKTEGDEAHIAVQGELKGEGATLTLKRLSERDPQVTVERGQLQINGKVVFLLSLSVPQRAQWQLSGEIAGQYKIPDSSLNAFTFRFSADLKDELVF